MIILADNDAIWKLHGYHLMDEAMQILTEDGDKDIRVLGTAASFMEGKAELHKGTDAGKAAERAVNFINSFKPIEAEEYDKQEAESFALMHENIDPGDSILISALNKNNTSRLLTGDKKCLIALYECRNKMNCHFERFVGRFCILETTLYNVATHFGWENVKKQVLTSFYGNVPVDRAITNLFKGDSNEAKIWLEREVASKNLSVFLWNWPLSQAALVSHSHLVSV